jgi:hypothetical protein
LLAAVKVDAFYSFITTLSYLFAISSFFPTYRLIFFPPNYLILFTLLIKPWIDGQGISTELIIREEEGDLSLCTCR